MSNELYFTVSKKHYNNLNILLENVLFALPPFYGKELSVDYFVMSEGTMSHFDDCVNDEYDAEEFAGDIMIAVDVSDANYVRIYDSENNETVYETACCHGGLFELANIVMSGILDRPNVPEYLKDFISLKKQLIDKINNERKIIVDLFNSKDDRDAETPFLSEKNKSFSIDDYFLRNFVNGKIGSSLYAAQEIMKDKVEETIFTNEEYKALLKEEVLSWFVSDLHAQGAEVSHFENDASTLANCFYYAGQDLVANEKYLMEESLSSDKKSE